MTRHEEPNVFTQGNVAKAPNELWEALGFDTLREHPAIDQEKSKLEKIDGVPTRTLKAKGGNGEFVERLTQSGDDYVTGLHFVRYDIVSGLPVPGAGTLRVESDGKGGSLVTWEAYIDTTGLFPQAAQEVLNGTKAFYQAGIDALQAKFGK